MASLARFEGYLLTDHSQGPGLNQHYPDETKVEEATITCGHCSTVQIKNPLRVRPREYCAKCDRYICDFCGITRTKPDYVHRSFQELAELVRSGRFTLTGSLTDPVLVPV